MKRNVIAVILSICTITIMGCANVEEGEVSSSDTSIVEDSTYEVADSQENVESQETEQSSETEQLLATENETEVVVGIEAASLVPEDGLSLMQKVLLNKTEFYGKLEYSDYFTETMSKHKVEEYSSFCDYRKDSDYFYVIDLDKDGKDEVCVAYTAVQLMIFHEENGEVYGYEFGSRGMNPLYEDGTFFCWGGVRRHYLYGNVSFENQQFSYNAITTVATEYDTDPNGIQYYYKDAEPGMDGSIEITKEEYDEIMSNYPCVEVEPYDFTIENILKYVK